MVSSDLLKELYLIKVKIFAFFIAVSNFIHGIRIIQTTVDHGVSDVLSDPNIL